MENVPQTRSALLPMLRTAASGAGVGTMGEEMEVEVEVQVQVEVEVEMQVEAQVEMQAEVQVERANASTPSLELTITTGIKSDQIKFNNNNITKVQNFPDITIINSLFVFFNCVTHITLWHRGEPETLCGSSGPGFCYVHCNADCLDIKHTASPSRSLSFSIFIYY